MESRIKFKIGEIEFEAEGTAEVVERERDAFMKMVLPAAIDAVVRTKNVNSENTYMEPNEVSECALIAETNAGNAILEGATFSGTDYSRLNLAAYLKDKGALTEQDFALFAAYFDEQKNGKQFFTKDDVERYYSEARRSKPSNISMSLNQLAQKGLIMDADEVEQKTPKPYIISAEGLKYINEYKPKVDTDKAHTKTRKVTTKCKSEYSGIDVDKLHLDNYPEIKSFKEFKNKMMLILYIMTVEKAGEWFTTADVMCLLTDIFGEPATKDQVNGVFKREKLWFKTENIEGNKRDNRRKLLNAGMDYARALCKKEDE